MADEKNPMNKTLAAALAVTVLSGAAWAGYQYKDAIFPTEAERFTRSCEAVLKERLKGPSTYMRLSVEGPVRVKGTIDEFIGKSGAEMAASVYAETDKARREEAMQNWKDMTTLFNSGNYEKLTLVFRYEAQNSFSAQTAGVSSCYDFVPKGSPWEEKSYSSTRVDGMTSFDWQISENAALVDSLTQSP